MLYLVYKNKPPAAVGDEQMEEIILDARGKIVGYREVQDIPWGSEDLIVEATDSDLEKAGMRFDCPPGEFTHSNTAP